MVVATMSTAKRRAPQLAKNDDVDRSAYWDRIQIVDKLGVSVHAISGWERRGLLKRYVALRPDRRGHVRPVFVYDPNEIARLPKRERFGLFVDPGELAARAFEAFDEGCTIRELVIKLRQTPLVIEELRERWLNAGGAALVITPTMKAELEKHVGEFGDVAELVAQITKKIAESVSPKDKTASDSIS